MAAPVLPDPLGLPVPKVLLELPAQLAQLAQTVPQELPAALAPQVPLELTVPKA